MFEFREIENPEKAGQNIVEILDEGKVAATLYPTRQGFKVVSSHVPEDPKDRTEGWTFRVNDDKLPREIHIRLVKMI